MGRPRLKIGEHGEVATTQRRDGRWVSRTRVRDADGETRQVTCVGPTKGAARRSLEGRLANRRVATTASGVTADMTIGELAAFWLEHRGRHGKARGQGPIAPQTLAAYADTIKYFVVPAIGSIYLDEVTVSLLDAALSSIESGADGGRSRSGSPGRSTAQLRTVLSQMFNLALRHDAILVNPMTLVESSSRAARDGQDVHHLDVESARLLRVLVRRDVTRTEGRRMPNIDLEDWVDLVLGTGVRDGEALALRWSDVDLDVVVPTAHIRGTLVEPRGEYVKNLHRQSVTKSRSNRTLILPGHLVGVLQARRERQSGVDDEPIFATRTGQWISPSNIRTRLRRATVADDALRGTSPHTLRRTVGTLIAHEVGLDAARDQLGHSDSSVTFQHYVGRRTLGPDLRQVLDRFFTQPG